MARLLEIVRANPLQFGAVGFLIAVALIGWAIENSSYRTRHR